MIAPPPAASSARRWIDDRSRAPIHAAGAARRLPARAGGGVRGRPGRPARTRRALRVPAARPRSPAALRGTRAIRAGFAAEWSAAPVRVTGIRNVVVHETADPEVVVAEQEAQISTATGRQLVVPFLLVLHARDGR